MNARKTGFRFIRGCALAGLILCLAAAAPASAADGGDAASWKPAPGDALRAIPNDRRPPDRLEPRATLPPREDSPIGVIRRVRMADGRKVVALTFDLCEMAVVSSGCDMEILGFLRAEGIPATLFMGGKWMRTHAARVRQIMARGDLFEIGNHAWTHGNFALLDARGMREQALWTQAQYELLRESLPDGGASVPPAPALFRLPYGRCNDGALRALAGMGFRVIQWDVVAESGADTRNPRTAEREARKVAARTGPGSILLFHANLVPRGSAQLLRATVAALRDRGFAFAKAGDLLSMGEPETAPDGYFERPGDNVHLDARFGADGTGRRK